MATKPKKVTAGQFAARLQACFGDSYEKAFSKGSGVALSTVYRWCAGDVPVPEYAVALVEFLEALPSSFRPARWSHPPDSRTRK